MEPEPKELEFVGSSRKDLKSFPKEVQRSIGYDLWRVQEGKQPRRCKMLKGLRGGGVLEILKDLRGDTFRVVYTVRFADIVYVLHAFQKKAVRGSKTPSHEIELVRTRLKAAEKLYAERKAKSVEED